MFPSERFLARLAKHRKTQREDELEQQIRSIELAFLDLNRHLPVGLVAELFDFASAGLAEGDGDSAFDRCRKLADVMDLIHGQYDEENDPLDTDDWSAISDIVSSFALDLDMDFVSYVMKLAVDHHAL